jgi:hypothetical protein
MSYLQRKETPAYSMKHPVQWFHFLTDIDNRIYSLSNDVTIYVIIWWWRNLEYVVGTVYEIFHTVSFN